MYALEKKLLLVSANFLVYSLFTNFSYVVMNGDNKRLITVTYCMQARVANLFNTSSFGRIPTDKTSDYSTDI